MPTPTAATPQTTIGPRLEATDEDAGDRAGHDERHHERDRRRDREDRPVAEGELEVDRQLDQRRGLGIADDEADEQGDRDRPAIDP